MNPFDWFAGNGKYNTLDHCLGGDWFWVTLLAGVDAVIFVGYCVIAAKWRSAEASSVARSTRFLLRELQWIFILCGASYIWTTIDIVWPGWRLLFFFKVVLAFITWRFAILSSSLQRVYGQLSESDSLRNRIEVRERQLESMTSELNDIRGEFNERKG